MSLLPDLQKIRSQAESDIASIDPSNTVSVSSEKLEKVVSIYHEDFKQKSMGSVGGHTLWFNNSDGQSSFVSVQEFPRLVALSELVSALDMFGNALDKIAEEMGYDSRTTGNGSTFFEKLPAEDFENDLESEERERLNAAIEKTLAAELDRERMLKFFTDPAWSGLASGRKLNRSTDWLESVVFKTGKMVAAANAGRLKLIRALVKAGVSKSDVNVVSTSAIVTGARVTGGENILFYGAPGTGKSHDVWEMVGSSPWFATVFHPDMQNSDFSGTLKPGVEDGEVTYAFRPGPFAEAVARAWKNPAEKVYLVIEELNRAVAAAVFGELFQLLDREPDGSGQYQVGFPSPEYADWFAAETRLVLNKLSLPSNLWILATMNSADQGVYPLDTAFRRRWRQKYLPIDYNKAPDSEVEFVTPAGVASTKWKTFAKALNDFLVSKLEVGEDRLVGPRFLGEHDLNHGEIPGKLLIYLWDDLLRHHGRIDLFDESIQTYGVLDERANSGKQIFSDEFLATIGSGSTDHAETRDEVET